MFQLRGPRTGVLGLGRNTRRAVKPAMSVEDVYARAEATLGEICDALRAIWGTYTEPASF